MKIWAKLFGFIFFVLIFSINCTAKAEENTSVISINELLWSGSHVSSSDEFIELKNNSDHNIDLSGWQITAIDSKKNEYLMITIPSGTIPAGGYFLIANSEKDYIYKEGQSILNIDPDFVDSSLSLSNTNLQVKLYDGQWDDGRLPIDVAGDKGKPLEGNTDNKSLGLPDSSMERIEPASDGSKKEDWKDKSECKENESECRKNLDPDSPEWATPESSGKPQIVTAEVSYIEDKAGTQTIKISTETNDPNGADDIDRVEVDLTSVGGIQHFDLKNDEGQLVLENHSIYEGSYTSMTPISAGEKQIDFLVYDKKGLSTNKKVNLRFFDYSSDILINEVFPAPSTGPENEFIELYNNSNKNINLYGWKLDDIAFGGSASFVIPSDSIILAKNFLTFYKKETKITLNDGGDTVRLLDPNNNEISAITYNRAVKNYSYNRTENGWKWSALLTPNSANVILDDVSSKQEYYESLSIKQAKNKTDGGLVEITGVVNSLPKLFSNNYFYIEDGDSGIEIYSHDGDFPSLGLGDKIKVKGEIYHTSSGWRLKIKNKEAIEVIENNNYILPKFISINEDFEKYEGMLVKITGEVLETSGSTFYIGDNSGKIKVYVQKLTNINKPRLSKGMFVEITGIISYSRGEWRIMPRFQDDLIVGEIVAKEAASLISKAHATANTKIKSITLAKPNFYQSNKARELSNKIYVYEQLIKITEIVIIISTIILIFIVGQKYVRK